MDTLDWLKQLVAFDTTSRNSNLLLIDAVQAWFKQYRLNPRLTYDAERKKANVFATIPAYDGSTNGGLILSGHTDVVPVDGQEWDTNPFELTQINDKLFGRGTCDMKGFIAVALALVPEFKTITLKQPVHFAFSYDEEVGCRGVPLLIADMQELGIKPNACIVGEPTSMHPVVANKGIQVFRCRVHGRAAHSSLTPQGCNAIEYAAQLICYIRRLAEELRQKGPFDPDFDVPFTSVSTNRIEGGTAHNIIPDFCEFVFEFRHLPKVKPKTIIDNVTAYVHKELLKNMQKEHADVSFEIDNLGAVPSFESSKNAVITELAYAIKKRNDIKKVGYATEAGLFQQAEIPTIICGPGDIEQAHRANEYVTKSQLEECEVFLRNIITSFPP